MKHAPIVDLTACATGPLAANLVDIAERELGFLHLRRKRLPVPRLSDAHWAILLDLYVARAHRRQLFTKDLAAAAGVGITTLLRYLDALEERELIARAPFDQDHRFTCVSATEKGLSRIAAILADEAALEGRREPRPATARSAR